MSNNDVGTLNEIWQQVRDQLRIRASIQIQNRLQDTTVVMREEDRFVVQAESARWLTDRALHVINKTLQSVTGEPGLYVEFTRPLTPNDKPIAAREDDEIIIELKNTDPLRWGYVQVPNYGWRFWQPLLGPGAFNLWGTLVGCHHGVVEFGHAWPTISMLSLLTTQSARNRRLLLGRTEKDENGQERLKTPGYLHLLMQEGLADYTTTGSGRHLRYHFAVSRELRLLTPQQVDDLPLGLRDEPILQRLHQKELERHSDVIDIEKWRNIKTRSLASVGSPLIR